MIEAKRERADGVGEVAMSRIGQLREHRGFVRARQLPNARGQSRSSHP